MTASRRKLPVTLTTSQTRFRFEVETIMSTAS
jgi:hypothetical protein